MDSRYIPANYTKFGFSIVWNFKATFHYEVWFLNIKRDVRNGKIVHRNFGTDGDDMNNKSNLGLI